MVVLHCKVLVFQDRHSEIDKIERVTYLVDKEETMPPKFNKGDRVRLKTTSFDSGQRDKYGRVVVQ